MKFTKEKFFCLFDKKHDDRNKLKKYLIYFGLLIICCIVLCILAVSSIINGLESLFASSADIDMLALKELIAKKELQLTEYQKKQMLPILQQLSQENISSIDKTNLKNQLYSLLGPNEIKLLDQWKSVLMGYNISYQEEAISIIERYTGISRTLLKEWSNTLSTWLNKSNEGKNTKELIDAINTNK